ncbi:hypothetical protein P153DRAFT_338258 [Dothidotthia symphoricarpi CBS 119687]|uniref:Uncharacterized protein n=1 Tax=Dothidotthia symphoricarpi CBS 119687 TaxID=1392245 RepID=A0A6A6AHA3_9PLEO|nr:uncharacterized protein P153DRAFT_338258 [Dothidotthia symphoricarpi CBS 119687]KAF2130448.1 hypothetical protein P153DRAFT_338258 [Dothidotthia symphoricarpi CBS 119687]
MTPRTRSSNKGAEFKAYYSKKVPQQVHFPHRKKVVRRRDTPERDETKKKQMTFLPDKMRIKSEIYVRDSDDESEQDVELESRDDLQQDMEDGGAVVTEEMGHQSEAGSSAKKDKKRTGDFIQRGSEEDEEPIHPISKRRRKATAPQERRHRKLRRQSTMTQLVDGRRPLPGTDEPEFKPIKHSLRRSLSGKRKKQESDKKQRTLTQMVPGLTPLGDSDAYLEEELAELEAQDSDSQAYDDAIAKRLGQQGLFQTGGDNTKAICQDLAMPDVQPPVKREIDGNESPADPSDIPSVVIQSVEDEVGSNEEGEYEPTQYIDAPVTRTRRTPRRSMHKEVGDPQPSKAEATLPSKTRRSRFSLLSTPEKRRVRVIPSSQSPPESPLFTQVSPQKTYRSPQKTHPSPLKDQTSYSEKVLDTPSKRRQVTFQEPSKRQVPPPTLRRFESTIQDSEDESDDLIEEDISEGDRSIGAHTPAQSYSMNRTKGDNPDLDVDDIEDLPIIGSSTLHKDIEPTHPKAEFSMLPDHMRSSPPLIGMEDESIIPSTPMPIQDDSSDDEQEPDQAPPHTGRHIIPHPPSPSNQHSADLDGEPVQVPRSPSAQHETQESHSSKAEQQLQREWLSYSQYHHARPPQSSSMHVAGDPFSYDATPLPSRNAPPPPQFSGHQLSQATTVDEMTPRKNRTQVLASANTTPRKIASSQPFAAENRPPPLFIPSSFPSPTKVRMEGWSSPVFGRTQDFRSSQMCGLEEFSIPPPPPVDEE